MSMPHTHPEDRLVTVIRGGGLVGVGTDGRSLWKYEKLGPNTANIPTPIVSGDYVFCSTTHPAVASLLGDGKWIADTLSPDQSAGVFGYNSSTYTLYFAACHGLAIDDPTHANARALGYNTNAEWVR